MQVSVYARFNCGSIRKTSVSEKIYQMQNFIILTIIFVSVVLSSACEKTPPTSNNAPANVAKEVQVPKTEFPTASNETTVGSLAKPTEAYKTAFELRKRKDIAGLKKIMSKDILEFLTMMGEDDKKSLDDMLKEMCDKPQADRAEARNEKIKGDRAAVEYLTETGGWKTMDFERVEGKWLLALPKADNESPEADR